jgi:hypothetical protein
VYHCILHFTHTQPSNSNFHQQFQEESSWTGIVLLSFSKHLNKRFQNTVHAMMYSNGSGRCLTTLPLLLFITCLSLGTGRALSSGHIGLTHLKHRVTFQHFNYTSSQHLHIDNNLLVTNQLPLPLRFTFPDQLQKQNLGTVTVRGWFKFKGTEPNYISTFTARDLTKSRNTAF